jgi:chromosome segregation ATPase
MLEFQRMKDTPAVRSYNETLHRAEGAPKTKALLDKANADRNRLNQLLADAASKTKDDADKWATERAALAAKVNDVETAHKLTMDRFRAVERDRAALAEAAGKVKVDVDAWASERKTLEQTIDHVRTVSAQKVNDANAALAFAQTKIANVEKQRGELVDQLAQAKINAEALNVERVQLMQQQKETIAALNGAQHKLKSHDERQQALHEAESKLRNDEAALRAGRAALGQKGQHIAAQLAQTQGKIQTVENERQRLADALAKFKIDCDVLEKRAHSAEQRAALAEAKLQNIAREASERERREAAAKVQADHDGVAYSTAVEQRSNRRVQDYLAQIEALNAQLVAEHARSSDLGRELRLAKEAASPEAREKEKAAFLHRIKALEDERDLAAIKAQRATHDANETLRRNAAAARQAQEETEEYRQAVTARERKRSS